MLCRKPRNPGERAGVSPPSPRNSRCLRNRARPFSAHTPQVFYDQRPSRRMWRPGSKNTPPSHPPRTRSNTMTPSRPGSQISRREFVKETAAAAIAAGLSRPHGPRGRQRCDRSASSAAAAGAPARRRRHERRPGRAAGGAGRPVQGKVESSRSLLKSEKPSRSGRRRPLLRGPRRLQEGDRAASTTCSSPARRSSTQCT